MFLKDGYKFTIFIHFQWTNILQKDNRRILHEFRGPLDPKDARVAFADTFAPFDWGLPWSFSGDGSNNGFVTMNPYPTGWFSPSAKKKFICSQENM